MKLEKKKIEAETARVVAARVEQEYLVEQRLDEIERLHKNIQIQLDKEAELKEKLKSLG